ncbi:hypothetical protein SAMN04488516_10147 [Desulfonauticus submarinus]|uniref:Uncharacterized protein n=1 Tax=Desulfonauticus submarinus TaxID=206665 RepID=A0A1G9ZIZ4_9BACT|nr:hypothetical protein [Desulfonauticus submarinus]SDN21294.1 hypothetical protein SAMN04488516_10147 [Desulfonauticus submarinus]
MASLIPTPDFLQVSFGWFQFFLILTFILHLIVMNIFVGWLIITLSEESKSYLSVPNFTRTKMPTFLAFTINFGVAPLLFLQVLYGQFLYTSSVLMGNFWISIIFILILTYYLTYYYDFKFSTLSISNRKVILFLVLICVLFVAFLFVNNMTLMLNPTDWYVFSKNKIGSILHLKDPTLFPRYFHFLIASVAIGGLSLSFYASFKKHNKEIVEKGLRWFFNATIVQLFVGLWFIVSLPERVMLSFLGKNIWATLFFSLAMVLIFFALFFSKRKQLKPTITSVFLLITCMVLVRDWVRREYLKEYFNPASLPLKTNYLPFILFILFFVLTLGLIGYMIRLYLKPNREV